MLKTFGAAMVASAAAGAGFWFAAKEKKHVEALEVSIQAITLLKSCITHSLMTLPDAMQSLSEQNAFLQLLIEQEDGANTEELMRKFGLGKEDIGIILTLFRAIPRAAAGSAEHFDTACEQLRLRLNILSKSAEQNAALYPKLGLLCGAAVFMVLV